MNSVGSHLASSTQSLPAVRVAPLATGVVSAAWGRWTRIVAPSFADCFFVAILVWLFVCGASGWKSLLMDGDTGWHIRTGEYILAKHAVPTTDLFSFSKPGAPWFAWEWLSDVVFGLLFRMGGLKAIVLFAGVLIAVYATRAASLRHMARRQRAARGGDDVPGRRQRFAAFPGAAASVYLAAVAGMYLVSGGGSAPEHAHGCGCWCR